MTAAFELPAHATLDVVDRWHRFMRGQVADGLDGLLDDDVILYSSGRLMVRPLQALNTVHELMGAALQALDTRSG